MVKTQKSGGGKWRLGKGLINREHGDSPDNGEEKLSN